MNVQERSRRRSKRSIRRRWSFKSARLYESRARSTAIHARSSRGARTRTASTSAGRDSASSEQARGYTSATSRRPTPVDIRAKRPTVSARPPSPSTCKLSVSQTLHCSRNFEKCLDFRLNYSCSLLPQFYFCVDSRDAVRVQTPFRR